MKKIEINLNVYEYNNIKELSKTEQLLIEKAKEATKQAYAPYSHFQVGAALLLANGEIITGANQENSAFPSGLCAERVALFYANAKFPDIPVKAMAITAFHNGNFLENITAPCGACRQVMLETEIRFNQPIKLILYGTKRILIIHSVKDLLPLSFTGENLKK